PTTENLVIGECQSGIREAYSRRYTDIRGIHEETAVLRIVVRIVGTNEDLVQVAVARAATAVHLDLPGDVAGRKTHAQLRCSVDRHSDRVGIGLPAVGGALHEDLGGGPKVVILHVDVCRIVEA